MAKWKAYYLKQEDFPADMPEDIKKLYISRNGRYEFQYSEFEELDALSNPGLAANRDKLRQEKDTAEQSLNAIKAEKDKAEKLLAEAQKPGTVAVQQAEFDQLKKYQELGPVDDVKKLIDENSELKTQVEKTAKEKERSQFCRDANLDDVALEDFMATRGAGIDKLFTKKVKVKDSKDRSGKKEVEVNEPWVEITVKKDGKERTEEHPLKKYMTEVARAPEYQVNAVFTSTIKDSADKVSNKNGGNENIQIPDESTGRVSQNGDAGHINTVKERNKKFIASNSTRRKPWEPREPAPQS